MLPSAPLTASPKPTGAPCRYDAGPVTATGSEPAAGSGPGAAGRVGVVGPLLPARPARSLTWCVLPLPRGTVLVLARGLLARDVSLRAVGALPARSLRRLRAGLVRIRAIGPLLTIGSAHHVPPIPPDRCCGGVCPQ